MVKSRKSGAVDDSGRPGSLVAGDLRYTYLDSARLDEPPATTLFEAVNRGLEVIRTADAVSHGKVPGTADSNRKWLVSLLCKRLDDAFAFSNSEMAARELAVSSLLWRTPVTVGPLTAMSYSDIAFQVVLGWQKCLAAFSHAGAGDETEALAGLEPLSLSTLSHGLIVNRQPASRCRERADTLGSLGAEIRSIQPQLDLGSLTVAVLQENIRLKATLDAARNGRVKTGGPTCRFRVESLATEDFLWLDNTRHSVSDKVASLFKGLIDAGPGASVAMSEFECRSRDVADLPSDVLALLDKKPGGGTRLLQDAWLS